MASVDSVARLLAISAGNSGGGGGTGGTSNYPELANKPRINGVELVGNKTTEDLGIEVGVSEETLIQTIAQESAARQKQDGLLQGEIEEKMAPANIKAGEGISVSQSGLDVTISATASYEVATESDIESIFSSTGGDFVLTYVINGGEPKVYGIDVPYGSTASAALTSELRDRDSLYSLGYELTVTSEEALLNTINGVFTNLTNAKKINLSGLNVSAVADTSFQQIFSGDTNLEEVNMSNMAFPTVTLINNAFANLNSLATVNMSGCSFPELVTINQMFNTLPALTNLQLNLGALSKLTKASDVIRECNALTSLDLSGLDVSNATDLTRLVIFVNNLESLTLPTDISNAKILDSIVRSAPKLTTIDFSGRSNSVVTSFQWGFANDTGLKTIDLTMIDFSNVTSTNGLQHMFQNGSSLEEVKVNSSWNISTASKANIFDGASISDVTIVEV